MAADILERDLVAKIARLGVTTVSKRRIHNLSEEDLASVFCFLIGRYDASWYWDPSAFPYQKNQRLILRHLRLLDISHLVREPSDLTPSGKRLLRVLCALFDKLESKHGVALYQKPRQVLRPRLRQHQQSGNHPEKQTLKSVTSLNSRSRSASTGKKSLKENAVHGFSPTHSLRRTPPPSTAPAASGLDSSFEHLKIDSNVVQEEVAVVETTPSSVQAVSVPPSRSPQKRVADLQSSQSSSLPQEQLDARNSVSSVTVEIVRTEQPVAVVESSVNKSKVSKQAWTTHQQWNLSNEERKPPSGLPDRSYELSPLQEHTSPNSSVTSAFGIHQPPEVSLDNLLTACGQPAQTLVDHSAVNGRDFPSLSAGVGSSGDSHLVEAQIEHLRHCIHLASQQQLAVREQSLRLDKNLQEMWQHYQYNMQLLQSFAPPASKCSAGSLQPCSIEVRETACQGEVGVQHPALMASAVAVHSTNNARPPLRRARPLLPAATKPSVCTSTSSSLWQADSPWLERHLQRVIRRSELYIEQQQLLEELAQLQQQQTDTRV